MKALRHLRLQASEGICNLSSLQLVSTAVPRLFQFLEGHSITRMPCRLPLQAVFHSPKLQTIRTGLRFPRDGFRCAREIPRGSDSDLRGHRSLSSHIHVHEQLRPSCTHSSIRSFRADSMLSSDHAVIHSTVSPVRAPCSRFYLSFHAGFIVPLFQTEHVSDLPAKQSLRLNRQLPHCNQRSLGVSQNHYVFAIIPTYSPVSPYFFGFEFFGTYKF